MLFQYMNNLSFRDIMSHLGTLYRSSLLVPFIGSGMSLPACTNWTEFLKKLASEAGFDLPAPLRQRGGRVEAPVLYRFADLTVSALRALPHKERAARYRRALRSCEPLTAADVPLQTKALTEMYWPLVLTTNYDDIYWKAAADRWDPEPVVLGRHLDDCHRVLRSLDENTPPIVWALQGFLGGQFEETERVVADPRRQSELINQLVVGHQQYQRAINSSGHFRRAFAEVFRRRSLLFLGSGLLEDYLVNLFGEIIHHHGPGPYPHFALLSAHEHERFDPWFLQNRLGVVPVFYDSHEEIPAYLSELSEFVRQRWSGEPAGASVRAIQPDEIAFTLDLPKAKRAPSSVKVRLRKSDGLPLPEGPGECVVISAGRRGGNKPVPGRRTKEYFALAKKAGLVGKYDEREWRSLDRKPSYVFRYAGDSPFYAIAARRRGQTGAGYDPRDLSIIPEAVIEALKRIDRAGFGVVHLTPIASSPFHISDLGAAERHASLAIHPFAQVLRGVRRYFAGNAVRAIRCLNIHVFDPRVWYPILAGKVHVAELLSSELVTHSVEATDTDGNTEVFAVTLCRSPTLDELLEECRVDRSRWQVDIFPHPLGSKGAGKLRGDMLLAPTMKVSLKPIDAADETLPDPS